ncbi:PXA domain-containing protein [Blastocladiella britannica]|nr:PXA domain-containing protein [Blastocladiella britannica]
MVEKEMYDRPVYGPLLALIDRAADHATAIDWPALVATAARNRVASAAAVVALVLVVAWPRVLLPVTLFALGAALGAAALFVTLAPADTEANGSTDSRHRHHRTPRHDGGEDIEGHEDESATHPLQRRRTRSSSRRASVLRRHSFVLSDNGADEYVHALPGAPPPMPFGAAASPFTLVAGVALDIDHGGALDSALGLLRDYVVRDFVSSWFNVSLRAPGPEKLQSQFPNAVKDALSATFMNVAHRVRARGAPDLLVDAATRVASDLVAHLRMVHSATASASTGGDIARAVELAVATTRTPVAEKRGSSARKSAASALALARAVDPDAQALAVRRIAARLVRGLLPAHAAMSPLVAPLLVDVLATAVLWPVVHLVAAPHFINAALVTALEPVDPSVASAAAMHAMHAAVLAQRELAVRINQTRAHDDVLRAMAESGDVAFFFTVMYRNREKRADALPLSQDGPSTPISFVIDTACTFPLKGSMPTATESVILQLCRTSNGGHSYSLVAEAIVPIPDLPHVDWMPFYDMAGMEADDSGAPLVPVAELWLELELVDAPVPIGESAAAALSSTSVATVPEIAVMIEVAADMTTPVPTTTTTTLPSPPGTPEVRNGSNHGVESPPSNATSRTPSIASVSSAVTAVAAAEPTPIPRVVDPEEEYAPLPGNYESWDLDTVLGHPLLAAQFKAQLSTAHMDHLVSFVSAAATYKALTALLDPADPANRAAIQQEAYDVFDFHFALARHGRAPLLPPAMATAVEERIVLDPSPALFDEAVQSVGAQVAPHLKAFVVKAAADARRGMTDAELLDAMPTDAIVVRGRGAAAASCEASARAVSVTAYDRVPRCPLAAEMVASMDPVAVLATRHDQLVAGVCTAGLAFVASSMNTLQMQMVVLDQLTAAADDDNLPRLMSQKSQVECKLMAMEPMLVGGAVLRRPSQLSLSDSTGSGAPNSGSSGSSIRGGVVGKRLVGGLASGAQSLKAGVGLSAAKSMAGVKSAFKGSMSVASIGSKFKRKPSSANPGDSPLLSPTSAPRSLADPSATGSSSPPLLSASMSSSSLSSAASPAAIRGRLASVASSTTSAAYGASSALLASTSSIASTATNASSAIFTSTTSIASSTASAITRSSAAIVAGSAALAQDAVSVAGSAAASVSGTASSVLAAGQDALSMSSPSPVPDTAPPSAIVVAVEEELAKASASAAAMHQQTPPSSLSSEKADALLEAAFEVLKYVFALEGSLRARIFGVATNVLRPTLGAAIQSRFGSVVDTVSDSTVLARAVENGVLAPLWPGGQWKATVATTEGTTEEQPAEATEEEMAAAKTRARELVEAALPEVVARILGKTNAQAGLRSAVEMLQVETLNRRLVIDLLETAAEVLVPEGSDDSFV